MISSDSSSHQRHYHPLFDFNEPFISKAPQVPDKILGAFRLSQELFFVVAEGAVSIPDGDSPLLHSAGRMDC